MAENNQNNNQNNQKDGKKRRHRRFPRHKHREKQGAPEAAELAVGEEALAPEESEYVAIEEDIFSEPVTEPEVIDESVPRIEIVGINFREAGKIYYFAPGSIQCKLGDRVIVDTARGVEIGTVKIANKMIPESEVTPPLKAITRIATEDDLDRDAKNRELELDAAMICKKKIAKHGLEMSLVAVEYTFDNSKLIFYFTCESRVDFRELVKDLASTFHTRIELRQIGIRDEAKMMGGLGVCGRKYCCAGFLTDFVQVSIKMAKEQNFSLNSSKVSGACGRLLCCLRYEHETYEEAIRNTPSVGSLVKTADGEGVVIETKPLASEIKVKFENNDKESVKLFKCRDVKVLRHGQKNAQNDEPLDDDIPTD
jgi:cell fate regulator YaaT (PSP1 superfamily)